MTTTIGITKLNNTYGKHASRVLAVTFLKELPRANGAPRKYNILKPLPSDEEYKRLFTARYTTKIADLIDNAFSEVESVKDELDDWYNNLPDSFQSGEKGDQLQEAVSVLGNHETPDVPACSADITAVHPDDIDGNSRYDRVSESVTMLKDAADAIQEAADKIDVSDGEEAAANQAALEELVEALTNAADEWEGVEIPGMY